ncbi:amidase domain-containing protein [Xylanibacillus composti]|uniref:Putative amidase domain-containing protein n=1 Tax=Xylanibacillus composti TaxID=1572762 RepID=A0A8J4M344_9BACL|nr:amidase domain-containing protein [Xylanibacillus composti]GIQ69186.1 hypothetical protein XYCOK13_20100 [Xylanibacillus composti]
MAEQWKQVLRDYAEARNRMLCENRAEPLSAVCGDSVYRRKQEKRLHYRAERDKQRLVEPVEAETRLRIEDIFAQDERLAAQIALRSCITYKQSGQGFRDERVERERVVLSRSGGIWQIARVTPMEVERRAPLPSPGVAQKPKEKAGSTPYLNQAVLSSQTRSKPYDRRKVLEYADLWWDQHNPEFRAFDVDCTNYVSQCLYAGGAPMNYTGNRASGWWYKHAGGSGDQWSFSWSVSNSLRWYLGTAKSGLRADIVEEASQLEVGDVIIYDWDGDGRFQHSTIVTGFDAQGMPLVNAHTVNSRRRYWDYRDSYAWSEATRYVFCHIPDTL